MPFTKKLQKFNATIRTVEVGTGDKTTKLGGGNTFPFYSFDAPTANTAKIGIEISDLGLAHEPDCIKEVYAGCETVADMAKKAVTIEGVDFLCLRLEGGDPNGENRPVEELVAVAKEVAEAVDFPLVVEGRGAAFQGCRGPSGKERTLTVRKGRKLQEHRRCRRTCLQSVGRRGVCRGHQPGEAA